MRIKYLFLFLVLNMTAFAQDIGFVHNRMAVNLRSRPAYTRQYFKLDNVSGNEYSLSGKYFLPQPDSRKHAWYLNLGLGLSYINYEIIQNQYNESNLLDMKPKPGEIIHRMNQNALTCRGGINLQFRPKESISLSFGLNLNCRVNAASYSVQWWDSHYNEALSSKVSFNSPATVIIPEISMLFDFHINSRNYISVGYITMLRHRNLHSVQLMQYVNDEYYHYANNPKFLYQALSLGYHFKIKK